MNTRQLSQGMKPTLEFERLHTFKSFRQFPELRKSIQEIESIPFASADAHHNMRSNGIRRKKMQSSTYRLAELSQSSLTDVSTVMDDFRKIMLENRRKNTTSLQPISSQETEKTNPLQLLPPANSSLSSSPPRPLDPNEEKAATEAEGHFQRPPFPTRRTSMTSLPYDAGDPLLRANEKLKKIAVSFDPSSTNSHLAGFQGAKLHKQEFAILLRRCLNIQLRSVELDALFHTMDADNSSLIDGVEFIRYFFHLGNEAKALMQLETKERQQRRLQRMKEKKEKAMLREIQWQKAQIASFTHKDLASMREKLQKAAFWYDPNNDVDHTILHRLRAMLSPFDFQQQVSKCFLAQGMQLHFSGPELAALICEYLVPKHSQPQQPQQPQSSTTSSSHHKSQQQHAASTTHINQLLSRSRTSTPSSSSPQLDLDAETRVKSLTDTDLDGAVNGYAFVTDFVHLCQAEWKAHRAEQQRLQYRRQRVLEMGQHTDIMPKCLGR
jgi:hypothetical protein